MEKVTLKMEEVKRLEVIQKAISGEITVFNAAEILGISERQVYRLKSSFRLKGVKGLIHGNRGRVSEKRLDPLVSAKVLQLARGKYKGFNDHHFTEKLEEVEGVDLSREKVRQTLREAGISPFRKKRQPKHRTRRERRPQAGMMLQTDGSSHDWLEGRGQKLTLIGAIDDANGEVPYALFTLSETTEGYMKMFMGIAEKKGLPHSVYADRHSIFQIERHTPTMAEQLNGRPDKTQMGRALDELGITLVAARSPQAKGRIERLWGTFQDRLISELRLADARTMDEANAVLLRFLADYNSRFTVKPKDSESAWRNPEGRDLNKYFCLKYTRVVGNDNTVSFFNMKIQIPRTPGRYSFAKAAVDIHHLLDGRLRVFYKDLLIIEISEQELIKQKVSESIKSKRYSSHKSHERKTMQP